MFLSTIPPRVFSFNISSDSTDLTSSLPVSSIPFDTMVFPQSHPSAPPRHVTSNQQVHSVARPRQNASSRRPKIPGWQLMRPLGSGTWTTTYSARPEGCPEDMPPDYAVKVLMPRYEQQVEAALMLRREALIGRQVSHPYVVSVLAARVDQAPYYIVMPRLDGASLRAVLRKGGPLPCCRALWIVRKVAEGLDALHGHGWLHGDVKPDNIVVSGQGHVTLVDLGFARPQNDNTPTGQRPLMGTLKYAAPESFVSSRTVDQRSDIYSLGVTLYELLTGRPPFDGDDPQSLAAAHLRQSPRNPRRLVPQLPPSINRLLQPMLAKDPLRRPQTSEELVDRLVRLEIETFSLPIGGWTSMPHVGQVAQVAEKHVG